MGENETSSSVQEINIQEMKDFIAKEFQLEIAEKFEGKLVSRNPVVSPRNEFAPL